MIAIKNFQPMNFASSYRYKTLLITHRAVCRICTTKKRSAIIPVSKLLRNAKCKIGLK